MARPGKGGDDGDRRHQAPQHDQNKEAEQEAPTKEAPETETSRAHNTVGNQALAAMLASGLARPDGGGTDQELSFRQAQDEERTVDYGGDDDAPAADDGPLTIFDITQSWNPGITKTEDKQGFLDPMPEDELPAEDAKLLALIRAQPAPSVQSSRSIDPLLQPSPAVVARALTDWARGAARLAPHDTLSRLLIANVAPPAPYLQDPWGRVLISRARAGAIASWVLLSLPALGEDQLSNVAFVSFLLELEGRRKRTIDMRGSFAEPVSKLTRAADMLAPHLPERRAQVMPRQLPRDVGVRVRATLSMLLDLPAATTLLPDMPDVVEEEEVDDDPLGLDDIIQAHTGGVRDPLAGIYDVAVQGAERMAGASARLRGNLAATCIALAETSALWSAGVPTENLLAACQAIDVEVDRNLKLLVEIARAAQQRTVQPRGLAAGLRRGAKALDGAKNLALQLLAELIGGLIPEMPGELPPAPLSDEDALDIALASGTPTDATAWLASHSPDRTRELEALLLDGYAGAAARDLADPMLTAASELSRAGLPQLSAIAEICAGPGLLHAGRYAEAEELGRRAMALGIRRRNGLVLAQGAMACMEALRLAGNPIELARVQIEAGRWCWAFGAHGALSMLARWQPPSDDA